LQFNILVYFIGELLQIREIQVKKLGKRRQFLVTSSVS